MKTLKEYIESQKYHYPQDDWQTLESFLEVNKINEASEDDLNWVRIVKCLRSIGTETKLVKRYIDLCIIGDSTIPERYEIIKTTKEKALKQMEELKNQLALLDYKEEHYKNLIKNNLNDNWNPMNQVKKEEIAV